MYEPCLVHELVKAGVKFRRQVLVPQLVTYLRLAGLHKGIIFNFNVARMKDGIKSVVA